MASRDEGPLGMRCGSVRGGPAICIATGLEVPPLATPRPEDPPGVPLLEAAEATPPPSAVESGPGSIHAFLAR